MALEFYIPQNPETVPAAETETTEEIHCTVEASGRNTLLVRDANTDTHYLWVNSSIGIGGDEEMALFQDLLRRNYDGIKPVSAGQIQAVRNELLSIKLGSDDPTPVTDELLA